LGRNFHTRPYRPWGPPSLLHKGYRVFLGGWSGRGVVLITHPIYSIEVKERVELYLYSPLWRFVACSKMTFNFTFTNFLTGKENPLRPLSTFTNTPILSHVAPVVCTGVLISP